MAEERSVSRIDELRQQIDDIDERLVELLSARATCALQIGHEKKLLGLEVYQPSRETEVLGHVQRGGTPSPFDRVLATRFGLAAVDAVHDGQSGVMVALRGTDIVRVPLASATASLKLVPAERYAEAEVFFG